MSATLRRKATLALLPACAALAMNLFGGAKTDVTRTGTFTKPPCGYTLTPTSSVVSSVTAGAGTGVVG